VKAELLTNNFDHTVKGHYPGEQVAVIAITTATNDRSKSSKEVRLTIQQTSLVNKSK
jgi:hypothetical protein